VVDRFELDEDAALDAGERAMSAGERLLEAHRALVAVLEENDGCWGDDDIGKAFANKYVNLADVTRANTEILAVNLAGVGDFINSAVADFKATDEDNARAVDEVYADNVESWMVER
jgi:hypothetical protein